MGFLSPAVPELSQVGQRLSPTTSPQDTARAWQGQGGDESFGGTVSELLLVDL